MPTQFQTALESRSVARGYGREKVPGFANPLLNPASFVQWTDTSRILAQRLGDLLFPFFLFVFLVNTVAYQ